MITYLGFQKKMKRSHSKIKTNLWVVPLVLGGVSSTEPSVIVGLIFSSQGFFKTHLEPCYTPLNSMASVDGTFKRIPRGVGARILLFILNRIES